jgi:hypothetical protein
MKTLQAFWWLWGSAITILAVIAATVALVFGVAAAVSHSPAHAVETYLKVLGFDTHHAHKAQP